jgi:hypothetical protein
MGQRPAKAALVVCLLARQACQYLRGPAICEWILRLGYTNFLLVHVFPVHHADILASVLALDAVSLHALYLASSNICNHNVARDQDITGSAVPIPIVAVEDANVM